MKSNQKFFICKHCGNMVGMVFNAGVSMSCCGEKMEELVPNTVDAAVEKHLPLVDVKDGRVDVRVGSAAHPMLPDHHIEWIYVETEKGGQRKALVPGSEAAAVFLLEDDRAVAVFAYCNLHGLWRTDI